MSLRERERERERGARVLYQSMRVPQPGKGRQARPQHVWPLRNTLARRSGPSKIVQGFGNVWCLEFRQGLDLSEVARGLIRS